MSTPSSINCKAYTFISANAHFLRTGNTNNKHMRQALQSTVAYTQGRNQDFAKGVGVLENR